MDNMKKCKKPKVENVPTSGFVGRFKMIQLFWFSKINWQNLDRTLKKVFINNKKPVKTGSHLDWQVYYVQIGRDTWKYKISKLYVFFFGARDLL